MIDKIVTCLQVMTDVASAQLLLPRNEYRKRYCHHADTAPEKNTQSGCQVGIIAHGRKSI
jgi:hypothetical protein